MNNRSQSVLVGVFAGLASTILALGSGDVSFLSIVLSACVTLPVLIAGLGWSNNAGTLAAATAAILVAVLVTPLNALLFTATTLAPAAWIAHLSNLSRPAEEVGGPQGQTAWYPLSGIMLQLCGLASLSLVIAGAVTGYGEETIRPMVDAMMTMMSEQNPDLVLEDINSDETVAFLTRVVPATMAAFLVMFQFAGWYVSCAIVRMSGRAKRPADFIPSDLRMPRAALLAFGGGLILELVGGVASLIGSVIIGAFAGGFMMAGLAMLHNRLVQSAWRLLALWLTYMAILILFPFPLIAFLFVGMLGTARSLPPSSPGTGPTNSNNQTT
ncbi:MAG: DUF2232 domain-containing protein [Pseudomonadota bacterium]